MSAWGKRSKVTLHSGGISPSAVRLRRRGASQKRTAPGRDIRDIGPDKGPRRCKNCENPVARPGRSQCDSCLSDQHLVREVRRELKRLGLPPLGVAAPKGSPYFKKRRQAEAALARLKRSEPAQRKAQAKSKQRMVSAASRSCPSCFVELPATRQCDDCT